MEQSFLGKDVKSEDVWAQNSRDLDLMNLEICPGDCIFQGHQGILMKITLPFGNIHLKILSIYSDDIFFNVNLKGGSSLKFQIRRI